MKHMKLLKKAITVAACFAAYSTLAADAPSPITDKDVLSYVQEAINWRHTIVEGDLPNDNARFSLIRDSLRQDSQTILKSCFDFANAESILLEQTAPTDNKPTANANRHATLNNRIAETKQKLSDMQSRLDVLPNSANKEAEREKLIGEIKVENSHLELLGSVAGIFKDNSNNEDTGLAGAISKLSESLLHEGSKKPDTSAAKLKDADNSATSNPDNGILSIASDMITLSSRKNSVEAFLEQSNELSNSTQTLIQSLRASLQNALKEGYALADAPVARDKKSMEAHRKALEAWQSRYKKIAAVVLPLGQINTALEGSISSIKEWNGLLDQQWKKIFHHFLVRFGVLGISLLIPFVFLEFAHRAIRHYVRDINRIRQLNVLRQIIFITLLILIIFLNFFTEFGSLATYAGFLTAGLAVALQTVLVSLTAHFFFFGRFGVRAGDRVTIAGVTGDVVQVGMLRIYLMELIGDPANLRPSGKIVAFPNSVLFNSTAFSKQISGTSYMWNDITFLLDPVIDFTYASRKILDAVNSVYKEYRQTIEQQYVALEQSTHLPVSAPEPKSEIRTKDNAITCKIFYPVLIDQAGKVYQQIIDRLIGIFQSDPHLKLVLTNPIRISLRENQA